MGKTEIEEIGIKEYKPVEGYKYIAVDENGVPYISPTTMKVEELVIEKESFKWSPERLHKEHPYLTLSQILCALSYYHDHKDEIDKSIKLQMQFVNKMRKTSYQKMLVSKLKANKR